MAGAHGFWLILLLLAATIVRGKVTPTKDVPPGTVFKSIGVCRHIQNDYGWVQCTTLDCLNGNLGDWKYWVSARDRCQQQCRRNTYSMPCKYGDLYIKQKSGTMVNIICQCSGDSTGRFCSTKRAQFWEIFRGNMRKVGMRRARGICGRWCMSSGSNQKNDEHCPRSILSPHSINGTTISKPAARIANYTCNCASETETAEDDGGELELPAD